MSSLDTNKSTYKSLEMNNELLKGSATRKYGSRKKAIVYSVHIAGDIRILH